MLTELINPTETWTVVYTVEDDRVSLVYSLFLCFAFILFYFPVISRRALEDRSPKSPLK